MATIVSPFDNNDQQDVDSAGDADAPTATMDDDTPLELTWENVDLVLEEMRPFLIQDGGNVAISEIDGPVVRLELQVRTSQTR
jgi:lysyl-tRNA synthetase class 2